jgi:uroporphyrin-III C-methyltransferase
MSASEQPVSSPLARSRPSGLLGLLALVLVLIVASAGYYWTRFVAAPDVAALRAQLDADSAAREALERRLSDADQRLQKLEGTQSAVVEGVDELRRTSSGFERALQDVAAQGGDKSPDWVLAECEYLIFAATVRLGLSHDATSAHAALAAADQRLRSLDHPSILALRERLALDLQALAAVPVPDIEGLALKFAAQIRKVELLHIKPIAAIDTSFSHSRQAPVAADTWRGALRAMWDDVLSLVDIEDGELPDGVLFDPKLRAVLEQNLKLELSSARLALLQHDTSNYRIAIEIVQQALERYFDPQDAAVKSLTDMLKEVRSVELAPTLPDISASLDAVRTARTAQAAPQAPLPPQAPAPLPLPQALPPAAAQP